MMLKKKATDYIAQACPFTGVRSKGEQLNVERAKRPSAFNRFFPSQAAPSEHPIAPGHIPLVGHLLQLYSGAVGFLRRSQAAVGPVFWVDLGFGQKRLCCVGKEGFDLLRSPAVGNHGAYDDLRDMAGCSLVSTDGELHRHMRSALAPPFLLQGLFSAGLTSSLASLIEARVDAWVSSGSVNALTEAQELTLEAVFRIVGVSGDRLHAWKRAYREFALGIFPVPGYLPGLPRYRSYRARQWLDAEFEQLIATERLTKTGDSFLSTLVHASDENGELLSTKELVDNLRFIFWAGHDTSASVLAWILLLLARHPELWRALIDEHHALSNLPLPTSPKELRRFSVAEAIFSEVLRLYPPAWFIFRTVMSDIVVAGRPIKAGTPIMLSPAAAGRDPAVFPDPERFDYHRWTGHERAASSRELPSFGAGPHFCLGYGLALFEGIYMQVALARACAKRGVKPVHRGAEPRQLYFPLAHPSTRHPVIFERV